MQDRFFSTSQNRIFDNSSMLMFVCCCGRKGEVCIGHYPLVDMEDHCTSYTLAILIIFPEIDPIEVSFFRISDLHVQPKRRYNYPPKHNNVLLIAFMFTRSNIISSIDPRILLQ